MLVVGSTRPLVSLAYLTGNCVAEAWADTERQILETEGAVTAFDREPLF